MTRRGLVISLHWSVVFLILTMVKGGVSTPWVLALFVALVTIWSGLTLTRGMISTAGPKLPPIFRRIFPWMHLGMHVLLFCTALAIFLRLVDRPAAWLDAWSMLLIVLAAGTFHGLFHFWRHTALRDGALRRITPKSLHRHL